MCDIGEVCSGSSASCPADAKRSSNYICRPSTQVSCDPAEYCTGTADLCPNNTFAADGISCDDLRYHRYPSLAEPLLATALSKTLVNLECVLVLTQSVEEFVGMVFLLNKSNVMQVPPMEFLGHVVQPLAPLNLRPNCAGNGLWMPN